MPEERMKRMTLFLSVLCWGMAALAQSGDTTAVVKALDALEKGLVAKDTNAVKSRLAKDVAYGHSNGWVQGKDDVVKDMASGYLAYQRIDRISLSVDLREDKAIVRERASVAGSRGGKDFAMEIFVLQLWTRHKGDWKLVMRQSAKQ
jgi:Domain of unknown function (DUF4440)